MLGLLISAVAFATPWSYLAPAGLVLSMILFIIGLILTISGLGLWRLRLWAWALAVVVLVLALLESAVAYRWFVLAIELLILIYLLAIKEHFY